MSNKFLFVFGILAIFSASNGWAQNLMDTSNINRQQQTNLGFGLGVSKLDYDTGSTTPEFKRKTIGATIDYGLTNQLDIMGQLGYIMNVNIESVDDDGDGFGFGFGARALLHNSSRFRFYGYGIFAYQDEKIKLDPGSIEVTTYDFHLGGIIGFPVSPKIQPYAGLDLAILDDGDIRTKVGSLTSKHDVERDEIINIKLGLDGFFEGVLLRPEITLFGEETIVFMAECKL